MRSPVIFITSLNDQESLVKGFDTGAVDYIVKPFNPNEVIKRVGLHLSLLQYRRNLEIMNNNLEEVVRKRTEELIVAKDKAEESNRLKSHFLSLMSHELRTPMMGIVGFSEILMHEIKTGELAEYATELNNASLRLKDTLESILNMSRIESTKENLEISEFNLTERIKDLLEPHKLKAHLKGIELRAAFESDEIITHLDAAKFDIIFNNVVDNAIKYTSIGWVDLNISKVTIKSIEYNKIIISDTGIGIPENLQEVIFEEFRQVDEGMRRNFEGVGLGLSLVKKYVQTMKGSIELNSSLGKGSEFTIYIPCHLSMEHYVINKTEYKSSKYEIPGKKIKLLLVEDDESNIKVNSVFLKDFCEISVARNSIEALKLAEDNTFECILMDVNLGKGLSGVEITKELRKQNKYKDIPIIACTAYALDGDKENFLEIGCSHYIAKPSSGNKLREIVIRSIN